ncbi:unnamed protein product, partial [Mesorhabditis spiculigera]
MWFTTDGGSCRLITHLLLKRNPDGEPTLEVYCPIAANPTRFNFFPDKCLTARARQAKFEKWAPILR